MRQPTRAERMAWLDERERRIEAEQAAIDKARIDPEAEEQHLRAYLAVLKPRPVTEAAADWRPFAERLAWLQQHGQRARDWRDYAEATEHDLY